MKLISTTGTSDSFELAILGYSKATTTWRDRNCLQCRLSTFWRQQTDSQSTPIQTWEINRLLSALRALWTKATTHVVLTFSEPGLSMEATTLPDDQYSLQIQLDHSLTPSWHVYPDFPMKMDLVLNRQQLQEAIQDLSGEIDTYPER